MGFREQALAGMERLQILDLLLHGRRLRPRQELVVLNYHRIVDGPLLLDPGVVSATREGFAEQVLQVARFATPVSIAQVCAALRGARLPENPVLITFDDGYRDNYELALPILQRHGVPATFFVTTGYIQTQRLPWWDRISYVVRHSHRQRLALTYPMTMSLPLLTPPQRLRTKRLLLKIVKQEVGLDLDRFQVELAQAAAVEVDEAALSRGLFMDWDEVRAMQAAGMDIGAHTERHRVLQTLSLAEAKDELVRPRVELRERLGQAPRAIAYPVGRPLTAESGLRSLVAEAGYELGFTFAKGLIDLSGLRGGSIIGGHGGRSAGLDPLNLPRLGVELEDRVAAARFKGALAVPRFLV